MISLRIVQICLDTVRKDLYDTYAPRLQNQATIRFEEKRAASSRSVPNHTAFIIEKLPYQGEDGRKYVFDTPVDLRIFDIMEDVSTQTELEDKSSSDVGSRYLAFFKLLYEDLTRQFSQYAKSESMYVELDASTKSRLQMFGYL